MKADGSALLELGQQGEAALSRLVVVARPHIGVRIGLRLRIDEALDQITVRKADEVAILVETVHDSRAALDQKPPAERAVDGSTPAAGV
jgi:hypothetical protein